MAATMTETRDAELHHLIGGVLCLDFANTLYGHQDPIHEYLYDYRDLVLWSRHAGLLTHSRAEDILEYARQDPNESARIFQHAIDLREMIFRVFSNLAQGHTPVETDLDRLHQTWLESHAHSRFVQKDKGFVLDWEEARAGDAVLWPVLQSAVVVLTSEEVSRVKQCGRCDWLFLDMSRNRSRRWCSMSACGNRVKMARRYRRAKEEDPLAPSS